MNQLISISPDGIKYPLPKEEDYKKEIARIEKLVAQARKNGQEIVVVMGVGFVGSVMAAIVADTTNKERQIRQVCHRHAETEHEKLLEDPQTQRGRLAGQGGGSGSGPHDPALRSRQEDPGGNLRL